MPATLSNPWDAFEAVGTVAPPSQLAPEADPWDAFEPVGTDPYQELLEDAERGQTELNDQAKSLYEEFSERHNLPPRPPGLGVDSSVPGASLKAFRALSPEDQAARLEYSDAESNAIFKEEAEERREEALISGLTRFAGGRGNMEMVRYVMKRFPYMRDALAIGENTRLAAAIRDLEAGSREAWAIQALADAISDQEYIDKRSWAGWVRDSTTELPAYGIELAMTGGIYGGGKTTTKKGVEKLLKGKLGKAMREGAERLIPAGARRAGATAGKWILPRAGGVAAQTLANPQITGRNLTRRMIPEFKLTENEANRLEIIIDDQGDNFLEALPKGFVEAYIEIGSERAGRALVKGLGKATAPLLTRLPLAGRISSLKSAIIRRYLARPGSTVDSLQKALKAGQWHGLLGEILEERLDEVARGALQLSPDFGESQRIFTDPKQAAYNLSVEMATLATPGAGMLALRTPGAIASLRGMKERLAALKAAQARLQGERTSRKESEALEVAMQERLEVMQGEVADLLQQADAAQSMWSTPEAVEQTARDFVDTASQKTIDKVIADKGRSINVLASALEIDQDLVPSRRHETNGRRTRQAFVDGVKKAVSERDAAIAQTAQAPHPAELTREKLIKMRRPDLERLARTLGIDTSGMSKKQVVAAVQRHPGVAGERSSVPPRGPRVSEQEVEDLLGGAEQAQQEQPPAQIQPQEIEDLLGGAEQVVPGPSPSVESEPAKRKSTLSDEERAELQSQLPGIEDYEAQDMRDILEALGETRTAAGARKATPKAEQKRLTAMSEVELERELYDLLNRVPAQKTKPVRPGSITQNIEKDIQAAVNAVPAFKGAAVEVVDAKGGVVNITRPDGKSVTVHFRADAELDAVGKKKGKKARGAYVYQTGREGGLQEGHVYLRDGASHETLNHEVVHWLEDAGVITAEEVAAHGGREGIAQAYGKWATKKTPNTLFEKIYAALESLFSAQKRLFRDIEKRGLGSKKGGARKKRGGLGSKKDGEQDVAFAEEKDPGYVRAKASTDQAVRDAMREVEKRAVAEGRLAPRRTWKKADEVADRMLNRANYDATKARLLAKLIAEEPMRMEDQKAADRIVDELQKKHIREGTTEAADEAALWTEGNFLSRSEAGRTLGRRDPNESPQERSRKALMEAVYVPKRKDKKLGSRARRPLDPDADVEPGDTIEQRGRTSRTTDWASKTKAGQAKELDNLLKFLRKQGFDLSDIDTITKDQMKSLEMLRQVRAFKGTRLDAAYEYWHQAILSGPLTQIVNLGGTVGHAAITMGPARFVQATVNLVVKDPKAATFGEFRQMFATLAPGIKRGVRNAVFSFRHEVAGLEWELGAEQIQRQDEKGFAIAGKKGKYVRMIGYRPLQAGDAFTKSIIYEAELGVRAYRTARSEGLSGKARNDRIAEIQNNPGSAESLAALAFAQEMAFQDQGGIRMRRFKKGVLGLRRNTPGLRYFLPFVNTPTNIAARGVMDGTPLGIIPAVMEYREARESGDYSRALELSGRLLAWLPIWLALAWQDEEDPLITGSKGLDTEGGRQAGHRTIEPFTMRLPFMKTRFSYKRIEPIATTLGLAVDWINAFQDEDTSGTMGELKDSIVRQMRSKTVLQGFSDVSELLKPDSDSKVASWGSGFVASWVPNLLRQPIRQAQPQHADRRIWGKGDDWKQRVGRRAIQKTEVPQLFGVVEDEPIYDLWGRPAIKGGPETTVPWQIARTISREINPADWDVPEIFVGDRIIGEYNRTHPEEHPYEPVTPDPYYTNPNTKKRGGMTDRQKSDFTQFAGTAAKLLVEKHNFDPDDASIEAVKLIEKSITDTRTEARKQFAIEWSGGKKYDKTPEELAQKLFVKYVVAQRRLKEGYGQPQAGANFQARRKTWVKKRTDARAYLARIEN